MNSNLASVEFLKNCKFDLLNEIDLIAGLKAPVDIFEGAKNPDYGILCQGTRSRIVYLIENASIIDKFQSLLDSHTKANLSNIDSYKLILTKLVSINVFCLTMVTKTDPKYFDAIDFQAKEAEYDGHIDKEVIYFFLVGEIVSALIITTKYVVLLKEENNPLYKHKELLEPVLSYSGHLISAKSRDIILNRGIDDMKVIGAYCVDWVNHSWNDEGHDVDEILHFDQDYVYDLAVGKKSLTKKLGAKLSSEFEKEIARIFDAFGYYVSVTQVGKKRTDLIISTPKPNSYTFMVDAKSCSTKYSFPTTDARAIEEYIADYSNLGDILPDNKFFLIISSFGTINLEAKLKVFSNKVGIPVRFMSIEVLLYIVAKSNWTIYPHDLLTAILNSNSILDKEWATNLIDNIKVKKAAFSKYLDSLQPKKIPAKYLSKN